MVRLSWKVSIGLILIASTLVLGLLHVFFFGDSKTLFFYLFLDIVFVPIQVLLVTLIIEHLLTERERQAMMSKLNMVIGAFFSEVGSDLILQIKSTCVNVEEMKTHLSVHSRWGKEDYQTAKEFLDSCDCSFGLDCSHLEILRNRLVSKRHFVLGLLQNSSLLEHESFTNLLWAICHLTEELEARAGIEVLPSHDLKHLEGDIRRAFSMLVREWLTYMQHLRDHYPYIYSLAIRTNPFNPQPTPFVTS